MSQTVEVKLYNNYSDPFVVHKSMSLLATVYCQFTENTPIDAPELLLDMRSDIKNFNYVYIEEFGRYYYCVPQIVNGNQMRLVCESDPLTSLWGSYSSSNCVAERSTSSPNPDIIDDMLPFKSQPKYIRRKMATGFSPTAGSGSYILTVGGK